MSSWKILLILMLTSSLSFAQYEFQIDPNATKNGSDSSFNSLVIGKGANNVTISTNGAVYNGDTTRWDDLVSQAFDAQLNPGQDKLSFNYSDLTLDMAADITTNSANKLYLPFQMSHQWDTNSVDVHVHFMQPTTTNANYTNFFAIMRWVPNKKAPEPWYRYNGTPVFTLDGTNQMQIHDFGCPPIVGAGYSASLDVLIEYDGTKGHDAVIPIKFVDVHYSKRSMGTNNEYDQ